MLDAVRRLWHDASSVVCPSVCLCSVHNGCIVAKRWVVGEIFIRIISPVLSLSMQNFSDLMQGDTFKFGVEWTGVGKTSVFNGKLVISRKR